jgi:hypothetical protein
MSDDPRLTVEARLDRWAAARERRNGVGGHGKSGTELLREAAKQIRTLETELKNAEVWNEEE